ncbi:retrovirus-related Pol polyprotein from transposon opus [Trichonephila clavipes]|nr:retrovirus-related Pol polyprotein from transposon opus [Trichonephila clavipes]
MCVDKGSIVADSFRSEQVCCAELALAWKHAKESKGNYYEVDGYLFHRDKILGDSFGQLVIPKCRRTEVLKLAHTSVFSSHMGPKKTLERIKYFFFWEDLRADVKKFCESRKECQLTRSVRVKDRSPITPVARPELPFQVVNMDPIGPIDLPSSKGHKYILCLVDQHTRWGEAMPVTSLSAKVTCEALLSIFSRTEIFLLLKREGFVEKNSAASWITVLDLGKWYFFRSFTKKYTACVMPFDIYMTKKVRFKIVYTSYGCNLTAQVLRMLEQFVVSRIVYIDILMQIWKNRVKQINFVLEWVRCVGSEIIPAEGKLERKPKGRPTKRRKMLAANRKKRWQKSSKTVDEKNSNSMVFQRDTLSEPSTSSQPEASYIFTHKAVFSELLQKVPCKYCTNCTFVIKQHQSMGYSTKMELLCESGHQSYGSVFFKFPRRGQKFP